MRVANPYISIIHFRGCIQFLEELMQPYLIIQKFGFLARQIRNQKVLIFTCFFILPTVVGENEKYQYNKDDFYIHY